MKAANGRGHGKDRRAPTGSTNVGTSLDKETSRRVEG